MAVMFVGALVAHSFAEHNLKPIVFAQTLTAPFVPLVAVAMLVLANSRRAVGEHVNGLSANALGVLGLVAILAAGGCQTWGLFTGT